MGLRGPKPVNVDHLRADAMAWAWLFYSLRDGHSGYMQRTKWGAWQKRKSVRSRTGQPVGPPIPIPVSEEARTLPLRSQTKDWVVIRPVMPEPEVWELLKRARTVAEIHKASQKIRAWMSLQFAEGIGRSLPGDPTLEYCEALNRYAENILIGKRMSSYAKTDRSKSDDKRVVFMAKVLAGARYGLVPITAIKRLSHWHLPGDTAERMLKDFVNRSKQAFAESKKGLR